MDYYYQNTFASFLKLFLAGVMLFAGLGCNSMTPAEYKAKNFNASDVDVLAGKLLTRDTINDTQGNTISYQYYPVTTTRFITLPITWTFANSDTLTGNKTTDNQMIYSKFDSVTRALESLPSDSLILIRYPANKSISYAVLQASSSKDIHIYTSLQYYGINATNSITNINEYITIDIIKSDTTLVGTSTVIPSEVAYCSSENILNNGASKTIPVINARYTAHLDQGVYLMRFTLSNPVTISNPLKQPASAFKLPSIANQFKVVVL
jgi:hypothetical protein